MYDVDSRCCYITAYTIFSKQLKNVLPEATDNKEYIELMKLAQYFPNTKMSNDIMKYFFNFADHLLYRKGDLKAIDDLQNKYFEQIPMFHLYLSLGKQLDHKYFDFSLVFASSHLIFLHIYINASGKPYIG